MFNFISRAPCVCIDQFSILKSQKISETAHCASWLARKTRLFLFLRALGSFLCFVIGLEDSRKIFSQSNTKLKTIAALSPAFSRASGGFLIYFSSDRLFVSLFFYSDWSSWFLRIWLHNICSCWLYFLNFFIFHSVFQDDSHFTQGNILSITLQGTIEATFAIYYDFFFFFYLYHCYYIVKSVNF